MAMTFKKQVVYVIIPIVAFLLGMLATFLLTMLVSNNDKGVFYNNRVGGRNQQIIKEMPAVKSFLEYLESCEKKDVSQIWDHMTPGYQKVCGSKENLSYWYYLVSSYDVKYIIPESEDHFYVFLRFEDDVLDHEVQNIKQFTNTNKFSEIIKSDTLPSEFLSETYKIIDRRFEIEDTNQVMNEIRDYVGSMTMQDIVTKDWRFPILIAAKLKLEKKELQRDHYSHPQSHDMIMSVFMEKDGDAWKVKNAPTIALSRWN